MDAQELYAGLRRDLADVEERIKDNSWLAELAAGRLSMAALRAFASEQSQIIPSDLRSFEVLTQRFAAHPAHDYLAGIAAGERAALGALEVFATAVGLDPPARQRYQPVPGCQVYPSYLARLARDGTPAEVAGAFLVNLEAWGSCCARMADVLVRTYQLTREDCAFFAHFGLLRAFRWPGNRTGANQPGGDRYRAHPGCRAGQHRPGGPAAAILRTALLDQPAPLTSRRRDGRPVRAFVPRRRTRPARQGRHQCGAATAEPGLRRVPRVPGR